MIFFLLVFNLLFACQQEEGEPEPSPPNILLILADDLGYGDLGSYNPESLVPTPNLDKLAAEGTRLTRAYCPVAVCSPTRYALMTGRYPFRSWKKTGVMANYEPSMIDSSILTLPEMLQEVGYTTAGYGKWHLGTTFPTLDGERPAGYGQFRAEDNGANLDLSKPVSDGPTDHGFDHWYGFSCASECWVFDGDDITAAIGHDLYTIEPAPNKDHIEVIPLADYLPHITDLSLDFLASQADANAPFFLYFSPYVPHIPLKVEEAFQGSTQAGLYGDYVHELDHYIGLLLDALDSLGMADNTLVLFASDNGSQFELTSTAMDMEQASNSPADRLDLEGDAPRHHPNAPLRGTKWSVYEGGVRTPFIVRWPGRLPAGAVRDELMGLNDLHATLAALVGYDSSGLGYPMDSQNMLPVWEGAEAAMGREAIVVQASGKRYGLVQPRWKYVTGDPAELYDLLADEGETNDVSQTRPSVMATMRERLADLLGEEVDLETE